MHWLPNIHVLQLLNGSSDLNCTLVVYGCMYMCMKIDIYQISTLALVGVDTHKAVIQLATHGHMCCRKSLRPTP